MANNNNSKNVRVNQTTNQSDAIAPRVDTDQTSVKAAEGRVTAQSTGDAKLSYNDNPADRSATEYVDATRLDNNTVDKSGFVDPQAADVATPIRETEDLRIISYDEATNLRTALDHVIGYRQGSYYRHDFDSGLLNLRTFGLTMNEDRAQAQATRAQEAVINNEGGATNDDRDNGGQ